MTGIASITGMLMVPAYGIDPDISEWKLRKEKDGITVYSRQVPGSKYEAFKGVVDLDASQASALALLDDVDVCAKWLHRCQSSKVLDEIGTQQQYVHQVSVLPFPVASRDSIFLATVIQLSRDDILVELKSVPDYIEQTKHVRIKVSTGSYQIRKLGENKIRLIWEQHIEPAGTLPAFMVNSLLTDIPYKSLANFRKLVAAEKYRNAVFVYDGDGNRIDLIY